MRVRLVMMAVTLLVVFALAFEVAALAQQSTNQSNTNAPRRTTRRTTRSKAKPPAETPAQPEMTPPAETTPQMESQPKTTKPKAKRTAKGGKKMMRGVPKGVQACIDHLIEMASADPLPAFEGHPAEIVNNGLLWNDPKSRCSIGSDATLRLKVSEVATAWRTKNAEKVRSLLSEIKSAAPQS